MTKPVSDMSRKELRDCAKERIFSLGLRDLASALSYKNMRYGLSKMIYAMDSLDVHCVFSPDSTITRNRGRWMSGFGYGALIKWPDNGMAFPEIRPNACGMVVAKLDELPSEKEIIHRVSEVEESEMILDGITLKPDFGEGNHFFEFYKPVGISPDIVDRMPEDAGYAILHGSAPERKEDMYGAVDRADKVDTPYGPFAVLDGDDAKEYYKLWLDFEEFSKKRREFLARKVLGECEIISNITHQGLFARNEIRIGCYDTLDKSSPRGKALFPVALRWDLPVYIFKGKENLSDDVIGRLGFEERARNLGLYEELKKTNILPHGGGYDITLPYTRIKVINTSIGNNFILMGPEPVSRVDELTSKGDDLSRFGRMIVTNARELPYTYRGLGVMEKVLEYDLGNPIAKLQPLMTVKI